MYAGFTKKDYQDFAKCSFAHITPVVSSILSEKIASSACFSLIISVTTPYRLIPVILSRRSITNDCKTLHKYKMLIINYRKMERKLLAV